MVLGHTHSGISGCAACAATARRGAGGWAFAVARSRRTSRGRQGCASGSRWRRARGIGRILRTTLALGLLTLLVAVKVSGALDALAVVLLADKEGDSLRVRCDVSIGAIGAWASETKSLLCLLASPELSNAVVCGLNIPGRKCSYQQLRRRSSGRRSARPDTRQLRILISFSVDWWSCHRHVVSRPRREPTLIRRFHLVQIEPLREGIVAGGGHCSSGGHQSGEKHDRQHNGRGWGWVVYVNVWIGSNEVLNRSVNQCNGPDAKSKWRMGREAGGRRGKQLLEGKRNWQEIKKKAQGGKQGRGKKWKI